MMKTKILIPAIAIAICVFLLLLRAVLAEDYYVIGNEPISRVVRGNDQERLIVTSGQNVYIVNSGNGEIVEEYINIGIGTMDICPGYPQTTLIYGIGFDENNVVQFSLQRPSGNIVKSNLMHGYITVLQLQDESYLYAVLQEQSSLDHEGYDTVYVFNKSDLSLAETWNCVNWPIEGAFDSITNTMLIAEGCADPDDFDEYPGGPGTVWHTAIGRYDPSRNGGLIDEYVVEGNVGGIAIMNDGVIVTGLSGERTYEEDATTFAVIDESIEYINIEGYQVIAMDFDSTSSRLFCTCFDQDGESSGDVLVWNYPSGNYEIIHSGIPGIARCAYLDGKLFTTTHEDNKLYVINID